MTQQTATRNPAGRPAQDFRYLPLSAIDLGSPNIRTSKISRDSISELAKSLKREGMLQPVVVEQDGNQFNLVAGRRRCAAAKLAGLKEVPALVLGQVDHAAVIQLLENIQRSDLTCLEEGDAYGQLQDLGYSAEEIAAKVGKSAAHVRDRLRLSMLTPEARALVDSGELTIGVALQIARLSGLKVQAQAAEEIAAHGTAEAPATLAKAREILAARYLLRIETAPFPAGDVELVPEAGSCLVCPKRSGAQAELFPEAAGQDLCTDAGCWGRKIQANWIRAKRVAQEQGAQVIEPGDERAAEYAGLLGAGQINKFGTWLNLDEICTADPDRRTYGRLVEDQKVQRYTVTNERGNVFTVAKRIDVQKALKRLGIGSTVEPQTPDHGDAAASREGQEERARAERMSRERERIKLNVMATAVVGAIERKGESGVEFWLKLVEETVERSGHDAVKFCLARRGLLSKDDSGPKAKKFDARVLELAQQMADGRAVPQSKPVQLLAALVVDLAIGNRMHEGPRVAREWAKAIGLDLVSAEKEATAQAKAKLDRRAGPVKVTRQKPKPEPVVEPKADEEAPASKKRVRAKAVKA